MKKILVYIILVLILVYFILKTDFDFSVIFNMQFSDFVLLSAVMLLCFVNTFNALDIQLRMMDVSESKFIIALLSLATNLLNYLPAKGGMLSLGTFLKVKKNAPLNKYVFTTILIYMLVTVITVLLSLFFILDEKMQYFYSKVNFLYIIYFLIFCIIFATAAYFIAGKNKHHKLSAYYLTFIDNRKLIFRNKLNLFYTGLIILGGIFLFSLRMYISFGIAGNDISMYHAFLLGVIANLSFFLSFTPGGLGVKEGFIAGVSYILFGNAAIGVVASLIDRAVNLLYTIITGSIAIKMLDKRFFSDKTEEK